MRFARARLAAFYGELYWCLAGRADALFESADAMLAADGPVRVLPEGTRDTPVISTPHYYCAARLVNKLLDCGGSPTISTFLVATPEANR